MFQGGAAWRKRLTEDLGQDIAGLIASRSDDELARLMTNLAGHDLPTLIDAFQANRAPDLRYRTSPIGAIFTHTKGGFYHDGRFATLNEVVDHYNTCMNLNLAPGEKGDLIQYLLSLTF